MRNIAQEIFAHSDGFIFDTRRGEIALLLVGHSPTFTFQTTKDIAFQIIAFAEFIPISNPLPIVLFSFTASENSGNVTIEWITLCETNKHFFILRINPQTSGCCPSWKFLTDQERESWGQFIGSGIEPSIYCFSIKEMNYFFAFMPLHD